METYVFALAAEFGSRDEGQRDDFLDTGVAGGLQYKSVSGARGLDFSGHSGYGEDLIACRLRVQMRGGGGWRGETSIDKVLLRLPRGRELCCFSDVAAFT